jgi:serine/threonine-protein kinase NIM1
VKSATLFTRISPSLPSQTENILLHNPKHRPNIDQILNCDWLQQRAKKPPPPQSPLHEARSIIQKRKKASFWCSKSRKTSPLSPFHQPMKQPEPIECYTKKYNNVPVEKFKNPLESDAPSSATTVVPVQNLATLSRNNSLINSSKNVSKRNGVEVQNSDIIQVRSYSNDDESSVASERDFEKFMMLPTRTHDDEGLLRALDPMEIETRQIMKSMGITNDLLEKHIEHGPRSEVIGIYRIVIMRLKTQKEQAAIVSHQSPVISDKLNNNHQPNSQTTKKRNATKCAIL